MRLSANDILFFLFFNIDINTLNKSGFSFYSRSFLFFLLLQKIIKEERASKRARERRKRIVWRETWCKKCIVRKATTSFFFLFFLLLCFFAPHTYTEYFRSFSSFLFSRRFRTNIHVLLHVNTHAYLRALRYPKTTRHIYTRE